MHTIRIALIHFNIRHKEPETNRVQLLELIRRAGLQGAAIVVAPELSVSGYSFKSREDILPYAENESGPTLTALAEITKNAGIYACVGLAERDARTGILYNSAFVLGPRGDIVCRYRKINAESRWACPGNPKDDNTFNTPWGRVGVLICSDSYHSLMPRVTALRGADLLLIPANWPLSGLDPREIWRARSLENGFTVAGCNRTGKDLIMDCRQAPSYVCSPHGETLLDEVHPESQIFLANLPLNFEARLGNNQRVRCMYARRFTGSHDCYLNLRGIQDLTSFLQLPSPGKLHLRCPVPKGQEHPVELLEAGFKDTDLSPNTLHILPSFPYSDAALDRIHELCRTTGQKVVARKETLPGAGVFVFDGADTPRQRPQKEDEDSKAHTFPRFDCGPARILIAPFAALRHPEVVLAAAKQGCDLAIASEPSFSINDQLLAGVRSIDNLAMAVCSPESAGIWMTPEGHQRWEEIVAKPGETCRYVLDTGRTRKKRFQDRIDFEKLLT